MSSLEQTLLHRTAAAVSARSSCLRLLSPPTPDYDAEHGVGDSNNYRTPVLGYYNPENLTGTRLVHVNPGFCFASSIKRSLSSVLRL